MLYFAHSCSFQSNVCSNQEITGINGYETKLIFSCNTVRIHNHNSHTNSKNTIIISIAFVSERVRLTYLNYET